jgi:uncharacterized protein
MNEDIEIRSFKIALNAEGEQSPRIEGYAATFNAMSEDLGNFREQIEPGFFDEVLADDARALFNHDRNFVLGRKANGTLDMGQDDQGLRVQIDPPQTQLINDLVLTPMKRGDINQMSFAFTVKPNGDDWRNENGQLIRILKKGGALRLYDVSVVTEPAYPQTSAQVRSKVEALRSEARPEQAASGGAEVRRRSNARKLAILNIK